MIVVDEEPTSSSPNESDVRGVRRQDSGGRVEMTVFRMPIPFIGIRKGAATAGVRTNPRVTSAPIGSRQADSTWAAGVAV